MMRFATTFPARKTIADYPFGHAVSSSTDNVCWKWQQCSGSIRQPYQNDQAGIATGEDGATRTSTPLAIGAGIAKSGTGTHTTGRNHPRDRACTTRIAGHHRHRGNRTVADTEKARCANTGPSRNSMIVAAGI
jgi:hypothetical protein